MKPVLLVLGTALFYDQGGEAVSRFGFAWQQHLQSRLA